MRSRHISIRTPGRPALLHSVAYAIDVVAKTPLDAARRFHIDFYGTTRGEIAVVGDFDTKQTEVLVNELFTDYRSKAPYARLDREYREVKPARLTVDTPERKTRSFARESTFRCATTIRCAGVNAGQRHLRRRCGYVEPSYRAAGEGGISYGAGTGLMLGSRPTVDMVTRALTAAGIRSRRSRRSAEDRARAARWLHGEGWDAKGTLQERATNRAQDNVLANAWTANMDLGRTFAFSKQFEDRTRGDRRSSECSVPQIHRSGTHDLRDRWRREKRREVDVCRLSAPNAVARALGEVDKQGVVFNAHYLLYCDVCVTEYWRAAECAIRTISPPKEAISLCASRRSNIFPPPTTMMSSRSAAALRGSAAAA